MEVSDFLKPRPHGIFFCASPPPDDKPGINIHNTMSTGNLCVRILRPRGNLASGRKAFQSAPLAQLIGWHPREQQAAPM